MCTFLYFPDDALADTSHSADLTDTSAIILHHADDVVATVFRVMLNIGEIVVVADGMKIFSHPFITNSYGGLVIEVEDVQRPIGHLLLMIVKMHTSCPSQICIRGQLAIPDVIMVTLFVPSRTNAS